MKHQLPHNNYMCSNKQRKHSVEPGGPEYVSSKTKELECRSAAADTRVWGQNTSSSIINWVGNYHQLCGGGFVNALGILAQNQPLFRAVASKGGHQCSV